ncbi:MAG: 2OG-Fe(II) oxygenase [Acetobacteraceae bacterium]|jgi:PKHD-type hydroxylase
MSKHQPIWYMGQIPTGVCDSATAEYMQLEPHDATMGKDGSERSHLNRNTTVRFAQPDHWFGNMMRGYGLKANQECGWGFDITDHEAVQFAHYGVGQHYDWHVDNFPLAGLPTDRKVTVICLMADPSEFEAGELQLRLYSEYTAPLVKGSIIAFPSILEHRVVPVTSGLRTSATMWLSGPRFR